MNNTFTFPIRVYYEDTDSGGVVYYANYLKFMERARTEYLRQFGYTYKGLKADDLLFVVRSVQIDYLKPAKHDDLLHVITRITDIGKASIAFEQTIQSAQDENLVFCVGNIKIVCVNAVIMQPCALPKSLLAEIQRGT